MNFSYDEIKEFFIHGFKFGLVGILNTIIGWSTFLLFFYVFKIDFRISNILSYILGLINSFIFNKLWVFETKNFRWKEIYLYLVIFAISFAVQYAISYVLKYNIGFHPFLSYVIGSLAYTVVNFLGNKFFTFKEA